MKGNLIIFKHSQHLKLDARLLAMNMPIYGVSRTHNSISMNSIQEKGRLSSIQDTADKNNPRKFMRWLKDGKNVLYAIDQDYGWEHSVKLKFFNQDAATITTVKKIIDIALGLEGLRRQDGIHAAAVVISPDKITNFLPIQQKGEGAELVTQYEMHTVEQLGLLKMDFLLLFIKAEKEQ